MYFMQSVITSEIFEKLSFLFYFFMCAKMMLPLSLIGSRSRFVQDCPLLFGIFEISSENNFFFSYINFFFLKFCFIFISDDGHEFNPLQHHERLLWISFDDQIFWQFFLYIACLHVCLYIYTYMYVQVVIYGSATHLIFDLGFSLTFFCVCFLCSNSVNQLTYISCPIYITLYWHI